MNRKNYWTLMVAGCVVVSCIVFGATLDEIKAVCDSKLAGVTSATSDMTMTMSFEQMGQKMAMEASGKMYMLKEDAKEMMRWETIMKMEMPGMGAMEQKMVIITAGEESLMLMEMDDMKVAMRNPEDDHPFADFSMSNSLSMLEEDNVLTVLEDATVDGQAVYVVHARPKTPVEGEQWGSQRLYLCKDTGLPRKVTLLDQSDKQIGEMLFQNLKTNIEIDKARFDMTVPAGYTVMD